MLPTLALLALLQQASARSTLDVIGVPNPRASGGWVSDPAHHLKRRTVDSLNAMLGRLERQTTAELAVVVVDSIGYMTPAQYALALHRAWRVGKRSRDNGIVFLWVPARRAMHVSVGYGLEGVLSDARVGGILDEQVVPNFRRDRYQIGVLAGVTELARVVRREAPGDSGFYARRLTEHRQAEVRPAASYVPFETRRGDDDVGLLLSVGFCGVVMIILVLVLRQGRGNGRSASSSGNYVPWSYFMRRDYYYPQRQPDDYDRRSGQAWTAGLSGSTGGGGGPSPGGPTPGSSGGGASGDGAGGSFGGGSAGGGGAVRSY